MSNFPECNIGQFSDALDGLLNGNELAELHQHLEKCASCSNRFSELEQVSSQLKALPVIAAPHDLMTDVRKVLQKTNHIHQKQARTWRWLPVIWFHQWRPLVLACAVLLVAVLTLWGPRQTTSQSCMVAL